MVKTIIEILMLFWFVCGAGLKWKERHLMKYFLKFRSRAYAELKTFRALKLLIEIRVSFKGIFGI